MFESKPSKNKKQVQVFSMVKMGPFRGRRKSLSGETGAVAGGVPRGKRYARRAHDFYSVRKRLIKTARVGRGHKRSDANAMEVKTSA